jgi:hypothetical protein
MAENPKEIVRELQSTIERLANDLGSAGEPDSSQIDQSIRDANEVVRKLVRLRDSQSNARVKLPTVAQADADDSASSSAGLQKREYVVLALEEIGRPASPAFISALIKNLWNAEVQATQFASIRKGDERAWSRGRRTRPLIVPALNAFDLSARPRTCAISTWPAERRLMGTLSDRVDALETFLLASRKIEAEDAPAWRKVIQSIAADFHLGGRDRDEKQAISATKTALRGIAKQDERERHEAAERLSRLSERWQLFGRPLSYEVVEGGKNA